MTLHLKMTRAAAVGLVSPLIPGFLARYPEVKPEISIDDGETNIVSGRFDPGVRLLTLYTTPVV
jgi:DNA-binding transcriptional LysR family regulator